VNAIVANIMKNALRPGYFFTMAHKLALRASGTLRRNKPAVERAWCERHAEVVADFARGMDPELWEEAEDFGVTFARYAADRLRELDVRLGGGGHYPLAYFLTRRYKPAVAVETGVAAGYTSAAILTALEKNAQGHLYSSGFPYFRLDDPEKYIGYLVEDRLKARWTLHVKGDRANIPSILKSVGAIDFFHYDSDKSYEGRRWALDTVAVRLSPRAVVLMDDIQDNRYFREHVEQSGAAFRVFGFEGKFIGALGI
jgi:predicted O-methyltransferase YrrM